MDAQYFFNAQNAQSFFDAARIGKCRDSAHFFTETDDGTMCACGEEEVSHMRAMADAILFIEKTD